MMTIFKGIDYLKNNGFRAFIVRTKLHLKFEKSKEYINQNGLYKLKKNNKNLYPKQKEIYIISEKNYANSKLKNKIYDLNIMGYKVYYYHLEEDKNEYKLILPLVKKQQISSNEIKKIKNKMVLLEGNIKADSSNILYTNEKKQINKKFINNISIIVLNHNNTNIIFKCLDSLIKYNTYNYQIIVVDNKSTDGSYEKIIEKYQNKIIIIKNNVNGCSSGRNLAIKQAIGDYLLFLDSDQIVKDNYWLDNYLEIINDKRVIGWAAGWFNKKGYSGAITDNFELRCMPPEMLYRTDIGYLGSGGLFLSKEAFKKTNGFDINYDPTGYEDTDISLQIKNLGYELIYCPYLNIEHKAHQTTINILNNNKIEKNAKYFKNKWRKINKKLLQNRR